MQLINLLEVINDSEIVEVKKDGETVATYDGKNSIDIELNNLKVVKIYTENNIIIIEVCDF